MNRVVSYTILLFTVFLSACQWLSNQEQDDVLASVDEKVLHMDDVLKEVNFSNTQDSAHLIESYIDNWIKEQLLIKKAKQNLTEEEINFDKQLESYRNSLIIYAYENQLVAQKLDKAVADSAIEKYYNANTSNFELRYPIIQGRYLQLISTAPQQDSIPKWLSSKLIDGEEKLAEYCTQFATKCQLNPDRWTSLEDLAEVFPDKNTADLYSAIQSGNSIINDSNNVLILDVKNIVEAGKTAPLRYVSPQIKGIIRNRNRLELIAKAKKEIYEEATLKKKYEIYY